VLPAGPRGRRCVATRRFEAYEGEPDPRGLLVPFAGLPVDPAEAQGLVDRLLPGQRGDHAALPGQGQPDAGRRGMVRRQPSAQPLGIPDDQLIQLRARQDGRLTATTFPKPLPANQPDPPGCPFISKITHTGIGTATACTVALDSAS
jgi:hypothetical protein